MTTPTQPRRRRSSGDVSSLLRAKNVMFITGLMTIGMNVNSGFIYLICMASINNNPPTENYIVI